MEWVKAINAMLCFGKPEILFSIVMNFFVIRAADSQIGQAFAWALAAQKKHLILLGQDEELLSSLSLRVGVHHKVKSHYFVHDESDTAAIAQVCSYINDHYDVDGLVNYSGAKDVSGFADCTVHELSRKLNMAMVTGPLFIHQLLPNLSRQGNARILMLSAFGNDVLSKALMGFNFDFTETFNRDMLFSGEGLRCHHLRLPEVGLAPGIGDLFETVLLDWVVELLNDELYDEPTTVLV
jgi:hypothetical protein